MTDASYFAYFLGFTYKTEMTHRTREKIMRNTGYYSSPAVYNASIYLAPPQRELKKILCVYIQQD